MSLTQLGRAKNLDQYWSEDLLSQPEGKLHIDSVQRENVYSLPEIEAYPYDGQLKLSGKFTFEIPGRKGEPVCQSGDYEYRTASGLFLVHTKTDRPQAKEVFSEINHQISSRANIQKGFTLHRKALWEFLEQARSIDSLVVRGPHGTYDAVTLFRLLKADDPIKRLYEDPILSRTSINKRTLAEVLNEIDLNKDVSSIMDLDIDWYMTVIESAEATFWHKDTPGTFIYDRGKMEIRAKEEIKEYLLQRFERDVLSVSPE